MSGKSRRRGRKLSRSQRKQTVREVRPPVASTPAAAKAAPQTPATPPPVSAVRTPAAKAAPAPAPSVSGELKRIGILAGAMLALLVVLYFVLPLIID
ncbi:MAG: hypothetical protein PVJ61_06180 [Dehalococcoidia bacterium]|jgi:hypothetical protein